MSKKIISVNAGPRKGFNTDTLINEAIKGATRPCSRRNVKKPSRWAQQCSHKH